MINREHSLLLLIVPLLLFLPSCISPGYSYSLVLRPGEVQPIDNIYCAIYFDKELSSQVSQFKKTSAKKFKQKGIQFQSNRFNYTYNPETENQSLLLNKAKETKKDYILVIKQTYSDVQEGFVSNGNPMGGVRKVSDEYHRLQALLIRVSDSTSIWRGYISLNYQRTESMFGDSGGAGKIIANQLFKQLKEDGFIK